MRFAKPKDDLERMINGLSPEARIVAIKALAKREERRDIAWEMFGALAPPFCALVIAAIAALPFILMVAHGRN